MRKQNMDMRRYPEPTLKVGIFGIILVSLYNLYLFGVGNDNQNTALFQDVEYRNSVLSGVFHADIQTVVFQKPVRKTVQDTTYLCLKRQLQH